MIYLGRARVRRLRAREVSGGHRYYVALPASLAETLLRLASAGRVRFRVRPTHVDACSEKVIEASEYGVEFSRRIVVSMTGGRYYWFRVNLPQALADLWEDIIECDAQVEIWCEPTPMIAQVLGKRGG